MAFSSLVFPYFLLITIDKIIFTFFLNFLFKSTVSVFPPFLLFLLKFHSSSIVSCISNPVIFFLFYKFLHQFLQIFPHFSCFNPGSSSIRLASFKFIISCLSFSWISTPFLFFPPFSFLFLLPHSSLPIHFPITPLWWFLQYSLTFPSFSFVAAFHSSSFFFHFRSSDRFSCSAVFFVFFLHILPHSISTQFSSIIIALLQFIITMITPSSSSSSSSISAYSFFFPLFFLFSSFSFLPLLFLLPPSSVFLHISVWRFPQFSLSFPGSGAPRSCTLSIPVRELTWKLLLFHTEIISISFGKCTFWSRATNKCKKFKFWNFWEHPLWRNSGSMLLMDFHFLWSCYTGINCNRTAMFVNLHKVHV